MTAQVRSSFRPSATPEVAAKRAEVAALMADGRARTAADVGRRLRLTPTEASHALASLARCGLLAHEKLDDVSVYQKAEGGS